MHDRSYTNTWEAQRDLPLASAQPVLGPHMSTFLVTRLVYRLADNAGQARKAKPQCGTKTHCASGTTTFGQDDPQAAAPVLVYTPAVPRPPNGWGPAVTRGLVRTLLGLRLVDVAPGQRQRPIAGGGTQFRVDSVTVSVGRLAALSTGETDDHQVGRLAAALRDTSRVETTSPGRRQILYSLRAVLPTATFLNGARA